MFSKQPSFFMGPTIEDKRVYCAFYTSVTSAFNKFTACFVTRIQIIFVWKISEFPDIVEFLDTPLYLSIQEFHRKAKEEFQNPTRAFDTI